jgi:hypothetical protein
MLMGARKSRQHIAFGNSGSCTLRAAPDTALVLAHDGAATSGNDSEDDCGEHGLPRRV